MCAGEGKKLITRIINDTLKPLKFTVHYGWMHVNGSESKMKSKAVRIKANSMIEMEKENINTSLDSHEWIYTAYLAKNKTLLCQPSVWLFTPYRKLRIPKCDIRVTIKNKKIKLISKTYCHGVHLKDNGKPLLSDNYFDLLPGIPKTIEIQNSKNPKKILFRTLNEI